MTLMSGKLDDVATTHVNNHLTYHNRVSIFMLLNKSHEFGDAVRLFSENPNVTTTRYLQVHASKAKEEGGDTTDLLDANATGGTLGGLGVGETHCGGDGVSDGEVLRLSGVDGVLGGVGGGVGGLGDVKDSHAAGGGGEALLVAEARGGTDDGLDQKSGRLSIVGGVLGDVVVGGGVDTGRGLLLVVAGAGAGRGSSCRASAAAHGCRGSDAAGGRAGGGGAGGRGAAAAGRRGNCGGRARGSRGCGRGLGSRGRLGETSGAEGGDGGEENSLETHLDRIDRWDGIGNGGK